MDRSNRVTKRNRQFLWKTVPFKTDTDEFHLTPPPVASVPAIDIDSPGSLEDPSEKNQDHGNDGQLAHGGPADPASLPSDAMAQSSDLVPDINPIVPVMPNPAPAPCGF